jgi:hypothetical protein
MISAQELRIGNAVTYFGKLCYVKQITDEGIVYYLSCVDNMRDLTKYYNVADSFDPIPLSPEILEAAGFVAVHGIVAQHELTLGRFTFSWFEGSGQFSIQEKAPKNTLARGIDNLTVRCLHELQNIIFALTGTEVEIKQLTAGH